MGIKTGIIKFNVTQRGRKFRGVERNFDTAQLASLINGGEVQEKVKHRDMLGYFGHWPRVKFGLNPTEGGILDGRHVSIEPAIVTTMLKAHPDGTIEHEAEFLDTASGKLAARMFQSQTGGFSSAIDVKRAGDKQLPIGFYGFDYVLEPNFTANRGYAVALDGVMGEDCLLDAVAEQKAMYETLNAMFDSLQAAYDLQSQTLERALHENVELTSMLAKQSKRELSLDGAVELDVVNEIHGVNKGGVFDADKFLDAPLVAYDNVDGEEKPKKDAVDSYMSRRFGV